MLKKLFSRDNLASTIPEAIGLLGGFAWFLAGKPVVAAVWMVVWFQIEHTVAFNTGYGAASLKPQSLLDLFDPTDTPQLRIFWFGLIESAVWLGGFFIGQEFNDRPLVGLAILTPYYFVLLQLEHTETLNAFNRRKFFQRVIDPKALGFTAIEAVAGAVWTVLSGGAFKQQAVRLVGAAVMVVGNLIEHARFSVVQREETLERLS